MAKIPIELRHFTEDDVARFWQLVEIKGDNDCWPWLGRRSQSRRFEYGVWSWGSQQLKPHRVAWVLAGNVLDPAMTLDHVKARGCRSKLCCNPGHLEQVTQSENTIRQYQSPLRLYRLVCKLGHAKEFHANHCRRCAVIAVARSQAKNPSKYRDLDARAARNRRAKAKLQSTPA